MYYVLYIYKWVIIDVTSFCCADYFPRLRKLWRCECECQFKYVRKALSTRQIGDIIVTVVESVSVTRI